MVGPALVRFKLALGRRSFPGTTRYWDRHYAEGGTSGPGSYGDTARFKADVINDLVVRKGVKTAIELGCGDGHQLSLCNYPRYTGLDVSETAIKKCIDRFGGDASKSFFLYDPHCFYDGGARLRADASVSLEVIFHLVEDDVYDLYMRHLFGAADSVVIVYSSNTEDQLSWTPEVRHRRFTDWVEREATGWRLTEELPSPEKFDPRTGAGSVSDFFVFERR